MDSVTGSPSQLDYAEPPRWYRRRSWRRAVLAVIAATMLLLAWKLSPEIWRRAQLRYWQSQCLTFHAPPDTVVAADRDPIPWQKYRRFVRAGATRSLGMIYLHEMQAPGGARRLVVVDSYKLGDLAVPLARVFSVGSAGAPPVEVRGDTSPTCSIPFNSTIFFGQLDPQDRSHFTFRYVSPAGEPVTQDGWLQHDDRLVIEERRR
jgi:hypothetical protein